jgi:hypothetical protein
MKKTLLFIAIALITLSGSFVKAQDVFNLSTTDSIITHLRTYSGSNIVLVIPQGYTNPLGATAGVPNSIDLSKLTNLTATTKITIKGDGTKPTVLLTKITLPPALSKFAFDGLTITGATTTNPTVNYIFNQADAVPAVMDSVVFNNCIISTFRSLVRFQSTAAATAPIQKANNVIVNNCIVSNFADYGVVYNGSTGGFFGPITVTKSTFYGMGATVFMLQKNSTSISISDCTFDNVVGTSAKAVVDMSTLVTPVTFTNCILGKSTLASGGLTIKTGGTLTITNCYNTTDWTAATPTATAGITGSLTAYSGASTALFTSPTVVTNFPGATQTITTGNYKILDATFAGANSAGDPRWYLNAVQGVKQVLSDKGVSFNGTEIVNKNGLSIEVYSILGKRIATSMTNIPTANFQKGIYIVRISGTSDSLKICI